MTNDRNYNCAGLSAGSEEAKNDACTGYDKRQTLSALRNSIQQNNILNKPITVCKGAGIQRVSPKQPYLKGNTPKPVRVAIQEDWRDLIKSYCKLLEELRVQSTSPLHSSGSYDHLQMLLH